MLTQLPRAAVAKEIMSATASSMALCLYFHSDRFLPFRKSPFSDTATKICFFWCAVQFFRLFVYFHTSSGILIENTGIFIIFCITFLEKVAGGMFECSRIQVEADWLVSVSRRVVPDQPVSMVFSPVFWMSASEVVGSFSGNLVKLGVRDSNFVDDFIYISMAVLFAVFCTMSLQLYMFRCTKKIS